MSDTQPSRTGATTVAYLPFVTWSNTFNLDRAIWPHTHEPAPHEVALFRYTFNTDSPLEAAEWVIFADTRYEAWLDGVWIGRVPARFSQATREYDVHQLDYLHPGDHTIAILVQWAPNTRRSESTTPLLQAHIAGRIDGSTQAVARTSSLWKTRLSDAWQPNAVQVHPKGLIGPTELVDLRQITSDWMLPGYADDGWTQAAVKDAPVALYRPRSIPLLENVPITVTLVDAGLLSPARAMVELVPPPPDPWDLAFTAAESTVFVVEVLTGSEACPPNPILLDGNPLSWESAGESRLDVCTASSTIAHGPHALSVSAIPPEGMTFAISTSGIQVESLPFQQGVHAGRRLLLAEPSSQLDMVVTSFSEGALNVEFAALPAYVVLDLGRQVHGRLRADVTGTDGTIVDVGWDQCLWSDTRPLPYPGSLYDGLWNQTDSWVLDGTGRAITTIDARAGRYILIAVWGDGPVRLENITAYEERYRVANQGAFHSSSPRLDEIWQTGVNTLYSNMTDAYTDTPWRERGQWWGDAYVEDHVNRVAFGDELILRRGLLYIAEAFEEDGRPRSRAPNSRCDRLLDYGLLWVQSLYDYWERTGDSGPLIETYPVLQSFVKHMETYENATTGLLDIPVRHWSQATLIDWPAGPDRYGQSTAVNALYYSALIDASRIADVVGASGDAST